MRKSAQKHHDQEQREQMDKLAAANDPGFEMMKNYGTFDHNLPRNGAEDMFEMFTTGPFQR